MEQQQYLFAGWHMHPPAALFSFLAGLRRRLTHPFSWRSRADPSTATACSYNSVEPRLHRSFETPGLSVERGGRRGIALVPLEPSRTAHSEGKVYQDTTFRDTEQAYVDTTYVCTAAVRYTISLLARQDEEPHPYRYNREVCTDVQTLKLSSIQNNSKTETPIKRY